MERENRIPILPDPEDQPDYGRGENMAKYKERLAADRKAQRESDKAEQNKRNPQEGPTHPISSDPEYIALKNRMNMPVPKSAKTVRPLDMNADINFREKTKEAVDQYRWKQVLRENRNNPEFLKLTTDTEKTKFILQKLQERKDRQA